MWFKHSSLFHSGDPLAKLLSVISLVILTCCPVTVQLDGFENCTSVSLLWSCCRYVRVLGCEVRYESRSVSISFDKRLKHVSEKMHLCLHEKEI